MPTPKPKPFNRFPQDFHFYKPGSKQAVRTRYTRAAYDGSFLRIWNEPDGSGIKRVYEAEIAPSNFTLFNDRQVKWKDPETNKDFTIMKSTGCGCKYNKLQLSKVLNP